MTDGGDTVALNPLGINGSGRSIFGNVSWGAADARGRRPASERVEVCARSPHALYIETVLFRA